MNCAPASIFFASRCGRQSNGGANGFSAAPKNTRGANVSLRPLWKRCSSRSVRPMSSSVSAVEIEHRLGLRMVAAAHTVAGEAQHVADAHRGAAQDVALDRDPVAVAARDLHHGRVADARQQRADGEARHVAVGAAAVRCVDRVDVAVEHARAAIDVLGIGGIGRVELGGDGECSGAQHALEAAGRRVSRQDRQRIARHRLVVEVHAASVAFRARREPRRAAREPAVDRSWTTCIAALPSRIRALPAIASTQTHFICGSTSQLPSRAHAAAGSVAQLLRAVHRARHAGRAQHALPAHPAVEEESLDDALHRRDRALEARVADSPPARGRAPRAARSNTPIAGLQAA